METIVRTSEEMFAFGQKLALSHKVILLEWELGAGKTTLIKWFAAGLGLDPTKVNSPTYTYIQEYYASLPDAFESSKLKIQSSLDDKEVQKLLHIDMYNVASFDELLQKGIVELVDAYDYIAIERPKFLDMLAVDGVRISIEKLEGDERKVIIND